MTYRMLADLATRTRAPLFDNPADWGLTYEDVEFETSDDVTLLPDAHFSFSPLNTRPALDSVFFHA